MQELKVITVKVPLHCPDCAVRVKEILLEHKSIYEAKTDLGKNTCTVEGTIDEKKLVEYIYQRTRKTGIVDKIEKKVIVKEEKVEVKKKVSTLWLRMHYYSTTERHKGKLVKVHGEMVMISAT